MSYSVYAEAAARFMRRFYERLVESVTLSEAVASARRAMYAEPQRESVAGAVELRDWMVPTLYQQEHHYVPIPRDDGSPSISVKAEEKTLEREDRRKHAAESCPEGIFGFIGRDYDILRIERALLDDEVPWVVLSGIGGVGKTELAYGFARWYWETGGCPGGVYSTCFKDKVNLAQVTGSIFGYGTDFSRLSEAEMWERLVGHLGKQACLLIWDNVETVEGYTNGDGALATKKERGKLSRLAQALKGTPSRLILTTRKREEKWLGIASHLLEIRGLQNRDVADLARRVLQTVGKRPEDFREDAEYARLVRLLKGHPRSLDLVLRQLRDKSPSRIIEALQHRAYELDESMEDASLAYSFSQLSPKAQKHLPLLGLFASYVRADTLGRFTGEETDRSRILSDTFGERLLRADWDAILDEAARNGLVSSCGQGVFALHPTLPMFLRRQIRDAVGEPAVKTVERELCQFYGSDAFVMADRVKQADEVPVLITHIEEENLLRALHVAESGQDWRSALFVANLLNHFYSQRCRRGEWLSIRNRLRQLAGDGPEVLEDRPRADLWMYLLGEYAQDIGDSGSYAEAHKAYKKILKYLLELKEPSQDSKIASTYHCLGRLSAHPG